MKILKILIITCVITLLAGCGSSKYADDFEYEDEGFYIKCRDMSETIESMNVSEKIKEVMEETGYIYYGEHEVAACQSGYGLLFHISD